MLPLLILLWLIFSDNGCESHIIFILLFFWLSAPGISEDVAARKLARRFRPAVRLLCADIKTVLGKRPVIWLHAVSVAKSASVCNCSARWNQNCLLFNSSSPRPLRRAWENCGEGCAAYHAIYYPADFWGVVRHALNAIRPRPSFWSRPSFGPISFGRRTMAAFRCSWSTPVSRRLHSKTTDASRFFSGLSSTNFAPSAASNRVMPGD